jgi:hypothetical protein
MFGAATLPRRFTASQEYADLLERAQDLLSHAVPSRSLEEVHVRALRLLVEKLERRKYGAPRKDGSRTADAPVESKKHAHTPRQRVAAPAPVRREVRNRDGKRCAFVDDSGQRTNQGKPTRDQTNASRVPERRR